MLTKSTSVADRAADLGVLPKPASPWRVSEVTALPNYRLALTFPDGLKGVVDMKSLIFSPKAGVFAALRDEGLFAQARLEIGAPVWPGEIDMAPDALYDGVRANAFCEYCPGGSTL